MNHSRTACWIALAALALSVDAYRRPASRGRDVETMQATYLDRVRQSDGKLLELERRLTALAKKMDETLPERRELYYVYYVMTGPTSSIPVSDYRCSTINLRETVNFTLGNAVRDNAGEALDRSP